MGFSQQIIDRQPVIIDCRQTDYHSKVSQEMMLLVELLIGFLQTFVFMLDPHLTCLASFVCSERLWPSK